MKKVKSRSWVQCLFCSSKLLWRPRAPEQGVTRPPTWPGSFPKEFIHISASTSAIALSCVWEHLHFISIYFLRLLATCVLRWPLLHFMPFRLTKAFIGTFCFQIVGETCCGLWLHYCFSAEAKPKYL